MKRILWLASLVLVLGSLGMAQKFRTFPEIKQSGKILIGTEGAFPPFNFFDDQNNLKGFDIDIGNAIAGQLGLGPEWKAHAWDTMLIALNQGRFDFVIASHTITEERAKAVDFTKPYYCTGNVIVSKPGGPQTPEELKGKVIGAQLGTTFEEFAKQFGPKQLKTYQTNPDAVQDLMLGRIDAWITDQFTAIEAIQSRDLNLQISGLLNREEIGMAVAKGNSLLLAALNQALDEIQANGVYEQISMKWFGKDIRCK
ncbi:amino acid ABC transporter substrate-binding protein, PAAT family [Oceanithermus profundus DSM 14977]|uniref:Amino acid ABC transporter substrate-binding protein, PAAT family n=1 Tax=Oceanithermus profundus (strain DSM 14977 / NBRC 100410 / VKM B-2274 / 506) TaxID=670487 RepID=E4U8S2_OCEP5|nr:ABC transporter substrate-binding protein [Oceanithermus profundus]ADR36752.1 amino acid ABC transporter substrate-binding protein, PAAT family [Oceanithermus profundus DSM 14977]